MQSTVFRHTCRKADCFIYGSRGGHNEKRCSFRQRLITSGVAIGKVLLHVPSTAPRGEVSGRRRHRRWVGKVVGWRARTVGCMRAWRNRDLRDAARCGAANHSPLPLFQKQVFGCSLIVSITNLISRVARARFLEQMCAERMLRATRVVGC